MSITVAGTGGSSGRSAIAASLSYMNACRFILRYPNELSTIAAFAPRSAPVQLGSKTCRRANAALHDMSHDPRIAYAFPRGGPYGEVAYGLVLTLDEVEAFYAFWIAAVGRTFRMLSPLSFPSYVSQRFAPSSIDPEAQSLGENRWGVALAFRDAA